MCGIREMGLNPWDIIKERLTHSSPPKKYTRKETKTIFFFFFKFKF